MLPVRHVESHVIETAIDARHRYEALRNASRQNSSSGSAITRHTNTQTHRRTHTSMPPMTPRH